MIPRGPRDTKESRYMDGQEIMDLISNSIGENPADIEANELTRGRIRTIYVQVKYGDKSPNEIAEYYNLPVEVIRDISRGRIFAKFTKDDM